MKVKKTRNIILGKEENMLFKEFLKMYAKMRLLNFYILFDIKLNLL